MECRKPETLGYEIRTKAEAMATKFEKWVVAGPSVSFTACLTQQKSAWFSHSFSTSDITKDKLVGIVKGLLKTTFGLAFLMQLRKTETETLVACIRGRVERAGKWIVNVS